MAELLSQSFTLNYVIRPTTIMTYSRSDYMYKCSKVIRSLTHSHNTTTQTNTVLENKWVLYYDVMNNWRFSFLDHECSGPERTDAPSVEDRSL